MEERLGYALDNTPIILSGMASSTIGMVDLPYKKIPFSTSGEDLETFIIDSSEKVKHTIVIISGARTADDVMRGEESKLIGCAVADNFQDHLYIFPGTHPKHVEVKNGRVTAFKTYMTGEFFELLSKKSILANSVEKGKNLETETNRQSFAQGVRRGINSNLLHSCFLVRTNDVFKKFSLEENYFYLSGLLIGSELKDVPVKNRNITVVANTALSAQYIAALRIIGLPDEHISVTQIDADKALIKGQMEVYNKTMQR